MNTPSGTPQRPRLLLNFILALLVIAFAFSLDRYAKQEKMRKQRDAQISAQQHQADSIAKSLLLNQHEPDFASQAKAPFMATAATGDSVRLIYKKGLFTEKSAVAAASAVTRNIRPEIKQYISHLAVNDISPSAAKKTPMVTVYISARAAADRKDCKELLMFSAARALMSGRKENMPQTVFMAYSPSKMGCFVYNASAAKGPDGKCRVSCSEYTEGEGTQTSWFFIDTSATDIVLKAH